jgi:fluoride exporter
MMTYLYIGIGGSIGAICRLLLSNLLPSGGSGFPWGTLVCNLLGCLLLGYLTNALLPRLSEQMKSMMMTGFIGSFTTFSTFSMETVMLIEQDKPALALTYVLISMIGGTVFAWLGTWLADKGKLKGDQAHG